MSDFEHVEFLKYSATQPRDARGRFSAAGDMLADAASTADPEARSVLHDLGQRALNVLHDKAVELAGKAKHVVTSTRLVGANPLGNGGVELRATHALPNNHSHVETYVQVQPHNLTRSPTAQKALAALHHGLKAAGQPVVAYRHPVIGATFKPGPAP
jgi:hypothetical protein